MLKKLLKHDMKAALRMWWIAVLGAVILTGICAFAVFADQNQTKNLPEVATALLSVMVGLGMVSYVAGMLIFAAVCHVIPAVVMFKSFFTDEGYLTFTLPVKRSQLFLSKFLTAAFLALGGVLVRIACASALSAAIIAFDGGEYGFFLTDLETLLEFSRVSLILDGEWYEIVLSAVKLIVSQISLILCWMFSMCVGCAVEKKHRVLASLATLLGMRILSSWITSVGADESVLINVIMPGAVSVPPLADAAVIVSHAALAAVLYVLGEYVLEKKLNLV